MDVLRSGAAVRTLFSFLVCNVVAQSRGTVSHQWVSLGPIIPASLHHVTK